MILNTQQYPTSSSGYTAQLQRNAQRCASAALLQRLNARVGNDAVCPPLTPIKIQTNSGAYTKEIQKCHNFTPTIINNCSAFIINGISAGGTPASDYTKKLAEDAVLLTSTNPDTRFDAYKPYIYPVVPSTIIFTSPTIPVPQTDACLLPSVNVSGPNPVNSQPTAVTTAANTPSAGYVRVTWTPGNDQSIVKYNIYVNGTLTIQNQTGTSAVIGPYSAGTTGTVLIEPVASNNWRGTRSGAATWSV